MENLNAENITNEIKSLIKALKDCGGWVKRGNGEGWFNHEILADALTIITSQEQRIKELADENERLLTALARYDQQTEVRIAEEYYTAEAYEELREENERLKNICESYMLQYGTVVDKNVLIKPLGIDLKAKIE
jgi:hypothetical protein